MDVIYAAEKRSIAELLGEHVKQDVDPEEIDVSENPGETGSFYIGWGLRRYRLSPSGAIVSAADERRARRPTSAARLIGSELRTAGAAS